VTLTGMSLHTPTINSSNTCAQARCLTCTRQPRHKPDCVGSRTGPHPQGTHKLSQARSCAPTTESHSQLIAACDHCPWIAAMACNKLGEQRWPCTQVIHATLQCRASPHTSSAFSCSSTLQLLRLGDYLNKPKYGLTSQCLPKIAGVDAAM
jgi:hypothetical protein